MTKHMYPTYVHKARMYTALLLQELCQTGASVNMTAPDDGGAGASLEINLIFKKEIWPFWKKRKVAAVKKCLREKVSFSNPHLSLESLSVAKEEVYSSNGNSYSQLRITITLEIKSNGVCILDNPYGHRVEIGGKNMSDFATKMAS